MPTLNRKKQNNRKQAFECPVRIFAYSFVNHKAKILSQQGGGIFALYYSFFSFQFSVFINYDRHA